MRILHFFKAALPHSVGGVEQVIDQLASGTSRLGAQVDVLALNTQGNATPVFRNGHTVHSASLDFQIASTGFSASVFRKFSQLAREADLIHYHFPWPFMDVVHFVSGMKKPTVVTYHSDIVRQKYLVNIYRPLMKMFLSHVDQIVATSPNYVVSSAELAQFKSKVSIIPIGLDKSLYPTPSQGQVEAWRSRYGCQFFAFVGVLRYYKGLDVLLEAAKGSGCQIVIAGVGPVEQRLKKMAADLQLENVHFLGFLPEDEKVALLKASYSFVFPSNFRSEAFGVSLLEAAMYGKPLISTDIGTGTSYINKDNETGLVVSPNDSDALRNSLQWMRDNPIRAGEMGCLARDRYIDIFTAENMSKSYMKIYASLLKNA